MNKKELRKLKPGMFLEINWNDSPNSVVLLLTKPEADEKGDISLRCLHEIEYNKGKFVGERELETDSRIIHTQVVRVVGELKFPTLVSNEKITHTPEFSKKEIKKAGKAAKKLYKKAKKAEKTHSK